MLVGSEQTSLFKLTPTHHKAINPFGKPWTVDKSQRIALGENIHSETEE